MIGGEEMTFVQDATPKRFRWDTDNYRKHLPYLMRFLSTLLYRIGRIERKIATARYVEGLLLPGKGKFIRPLAERLGVDAQSVQQAVTNSRWNDNQIWSSIRANIIPLVEPLPLWVVQERAWEKQGSATVGVANQRSGANGKSAHCQVSVEVLGSNGVIAAPLASRLFLPEEWANDSERRLRAAVPAEVIYLGKSSLAFRLIEEAVDDGLAPGMVIADSRYGSDQDFRVALARSNIEFFLEVDPEQITAWDFDGEAPDSLNNLQPRAITLGEITKNISSNEWRRCCWLTEHGVRHGTRLAVREVFLDPGIYSVHGNLEKLFFVVDWPAEMDKPYRTYLANWTSPRTDAQCLRYSRFHSYREHYHGLYESSLDLGSYQGRSWQGFHHHLVLAAAAYLFVLTVELKSSAHFWFELPDDLPIDAAIAAETKRLAATLLRSGAEGTHSNAVACAAYPANGEKGLTLASNVRRA
jgi:SRSO17 transposase